MTCDDMPKRGSIYVCPCDGCGFEVIVTAPCACDPAVCVCNGPTCPCGGRMKKEELYAPRIEY